MLVVLETNSELIVTEIVASQNECYHVPPERSKNVR